MHLKLNIIYKSEQKIIYKFHPISTEIQDA